MRSVGATTPRGVSSFHLVAHSFGGDPKTRSETLSWRVSAFGEMGTVEAIFPMAFWEAHGGDINYEYGLTERAHKPPEIPKSEFTVGTKRIEGVGFLYCMLRIKASILILALMVSPLVSLCGVQSGTAKQCPPLCPMMHGGTLETAEQTAKMQTDDMECHHGESKKQDCLMKSGCGHTLDLSLASPLPPAVLWLPMELIPAGANAALRFTGTVPSLAGFKTPPFQPPRA